MDEAMKRLALLMLLLLIAACGGKTGPTPKADTPITTTTASPSERPIFYTPKDARRLDTTAGPVWLGSDGTLYGHCAVIEKMHVDHTLIEGKDINSLGSICQ